MAEIVALGEILVEMMATEVGQTFRAPGLFAGPYPSGAPAIFADQAARCDATAALIGCVGDDDFGTLNIERLRASGVDVSAIRRITGSTTGIAFVTYRPDGGRDFIFTIAQSAAAALDASQIEPELFSGCRWFHVMGSSLFSAQIAAAVRRSADLARAAGARISFDPNIRKELLGRPEITTVLREILEQCDLLLPSEADLAHLFPGLSEDTAAQRLLDAGRALVVLKRGKLGCVLYAPGQRVALPAHPVEEVDPTGAGDCFGATFVAALCRGRSATEALRLANAAGAIAVGRRGPMEGNCRLSAIEAFLERADRG